jgi:hypothetical protein
MYRFEARIIGRSHGKSATKSASHNTGKRTSAVASAAYLSRSELKDERSGEIWDYSKHFGGAGAQLLLPANAPAWMNDRSKLWNQVEWTENRINSMLARDYIITMPYGLTRDQQWAAVKEFAHEQFVSEGKPADIGLHVYGEPWNARAKATKVKVDEWTQQGYRFYELDKLPENDTGPHVAIIRGQRGQIKQFALYQPHMHLMTTFRKIDPDTKTGFSKQKDTVTKGVHWAVQDKAHLRDLRKAWADTLNKHLAMAGRSERVTHLSLSAQGIDREPEPKKGPIAAKMEREDRGHESHAVLDWRASRERNAERADINSHQAKLEAEIIDLLAERRRRAEKETEMSGQQDEKRRKEADGNMAQEVAGLKQAEDSQRRADDFIRINGQLSDRAKADQQKLEDEAKRRTAAGDITDPKARYAQASTEFDIRRPFSSLCDVAAKENSIYHQQQDDLSKQAAEEKDPAKRKLLLLRKDIEHSDYMQITTERLAGISYVVTGRKDKDSQYQKDVERAREWKEKGRLLREERRNFEKEREERNMAEYSSQIAQMDRQASGQIRFGRDQPRGAQPYRHEHDPNTNKDNGAARTVELNGKAVPVRNEGRASREERKDAKREISSSEERKERLDAANQRAADPGRSSGGMSR